jgi:diguanylate cyclase (GGDEF)-like protein
MKRLLTPSAQRLPKMANAPAVSIIGRLFRLNALIAAGIGVLTLVAYLLLAEFVATHTITGSYSKQMQVTAGSMADAVHARDRTQVSARLATIAADPSLMAITVLDSAGQRLYTQVAPGHTHDLEITHFQDVSTPTIRQHEDHFDLIVPVIHNSLQVGWLISDLSLQQITRTKWIAVAISLAIFLAGTAVYTTSLWYVLRRALAPLKFLSDAMQHIAIDRTYQQRLGVKRNDEIGQLSRGFNAMLDALESRENAWHDEMDKRRTAETQLATQSQLDPLTGLGNRRWFGEELDRLSQLLRQTPRPVAMMAIDLDNFKTINDSHGHEAGDQLLHELGRRIKRAVEKRGAVYRLGGDEFAAVLHDPGSESQVAGLAAELLKTAHEPVVCGSLELRSAVSIGIAYCAAGRDDMRALIKEADAALYAAKEAGKGRYRFFDPDLDNAVHRRAKVYQRLLRAIEHRSLTQHYQPIFCAESGRIVALEALLRWTDKELGQVPPIECITVAEETGLIVQVGDLVLEQACMAAATLSARGLSKVPVYVNVSPRQFREPNFVAKLTRLFVAHAINASQIALEITESVLMDSEQARATLRDLASLGVCISIDDFGTGYSSLSYVATLPVSSMKIDRSFVQRLMHEKAAHEITAAIIALGKQLNLKMVAEGIEDHAQRERLVQMGCPLLQGFLLAKPMPLPHVLELFAAPRLVA